MVPYKETIPARDLRLEGKLGGEVWVGELVANVGDRNCVTHYGCLAYGSTASVSEAVQLRMALDVHQDLQADDGSWISRHVPNGRAI